MANIDIYSIDTNGGPIFEKPNITKRKPYSKDTNHKAASIEGATAIIDSVFEDIKNLTEDIEVLKGELGTLSDYWNDCIELENKKLEYVPMKDLNNSIEELYETFDTGMANCNSILSEYNDTINEINNYLDVLQSNCSEWATVEKKKLDLTLKYASKIDQTGYNEELVSINNELKEYCEIPYITNYGRWVE